MERPTDLIRCQSGEFLLDMRLRVLFRLSGGPAPEPIALGSRAFDILCLLVEHRGALVPRQTVLDRVWPDVAVEDNNLTVQISALRRVLDAGRAQGSCIQTIPGRGYRLVPDLEFASTPATDALTPVTAKQPDSLERAEPLDSGNDNGMTVARDPMPHSIPSAQDSGAGRSPEARWRWSGHAGWVVAAVCLLIGGLAGSFAWNTSRTLASIDRPRLSLVVLPFQNLSGNPGEDYLADGITDDLTSDLSHIPQAFVIARESAYTYKDKPTDVRQIGRELGVRYVLEGSVRRIGITLRINVQLVSADTGNHLWADRFDQDISNLGAGQDQILARMRGELGIGLVEIEATRSRRERPTNPDASDLILRARWTINQPPSPRRSQEALALFEAALRLDAESVTAMTGLANILSDQSMSWAGQWISGGDQQRAARLVADALRLAPTSEQALVAQLRLLHGQLRMRELLIPATRLVELYPNNPDGYHYLARGKENTGQFEDAIPLFKKAIEIDPRDPRIFHTYGYMAFTMMQAGLYADAATWFARSLAANPDAPPPVRATRYRNMSAALALDGKLDEARKASEEAQHLWPFDTVRSHFPYDLTNAALVARELNYRRGLGLGGVRDHADENAVFDVAPDNELHVDLAGYTPQKTPGATTLRTDAVFAMLASPNKPIVLDTVMHSWGRSVPGAIGLIGAGLGGSIADAAQDRLRQKLNVLTLGDLSKPIVTVGWNSERFDGRNLALRLVAMGYTNVYWYRGGREAWEVNNLPETELTVAEW